MRLNLIDRAIGIVSPAAALKRGHARGLLDAVRGYDGAARGRRTEGWFAPASSADTEILRSLPLLRARMRDLTRNNPHARKALSVWATNLVGTGLIPRAATADPDYNKRVDDLFAAWSQQCDFDRQLDFAGLQELAVRQMVEGGETLIRRKLLSSSAQPVPLHLQLMEGDLLDHSRTIRTQTQRIINGVQFDDQGQRSNYWLFPEHPGNYGLSPVGSYAVVSSPVPANEIVHLYRKERTQIRGVPWGSACIIRFRDNDDYEDAEILRKKIEACVVAIVTGAEVDDPGIAPTGSNGARVTDAAGNPIERFEPGLIAYAERGKQITFNNPTQLGGFDVYKKLALHSVAAGYLLPYELLTGDLADVNFSSARVGLVDFRTLVEVIRRLCIIPMALQPIWNWFCNFAILAGQLPAPAPGVTAIPCKWDTPAFQSVNPIDDANADILDMRAGKRTLFDVIATRTGRDPKEVLAEHKEVFALLDQFGLVFDSDPRRVSRQGVEQQPSQQASEAQGPPARLSVIPGGR